MSWLLIIGIALIIAVVLVLLLCPFTFSAESTRNRGLISGSFSINWLIFWIRYSLDNKQTDLHILSRRIISRQDKEKPIKSEEMKSEETKKPASPMKIGRTMQFTEVVGPLLRLIKELILTIRFRYVTIDTTYGLGDPAYTGILTGFLHAVLSPTHMGRKIRFNPEYDKTILDWDVKVSAAIRPVRIFPPIVRFVSNRKVLRTGWVMIRA